MQKRRGAKRATEVEPVYDVITLSNIGGKAYIAPDWEEAGDDAEGEFVLVYDVHQ
jgi:hypothetical protein